MPAVGFCCRQVVVPHSGEHTHTHTRALTRSHTVQTTHRHVHIYTQKQFQTQRPLSVFAISLPRPVRCILAACEHTSLQMGHNFKGSWHRLPITKLLQLSLPFFFTTFIDNSLRPCQITTVCPNAPLRCFPSSHTADVVLLLLRE